MRSRGQHESLKGCYRYNPAEIPGEQTLTGFQSQCRVKNWRGISFGPVSSASP
jgi:hypothetical protein